MPARAVLLALVCAQLLFAAGQPRTSAPSQLPRAPQPQALRVFAFGDPIALAQSLLLHLQSLEVEAGASIPLARLDYRNVETWLQRVLDLDPAAGYPLLLATHVYAQVPDAARQRQMLEFTYRAYLRDPARRWRWLAHACLMARHRLRDLPLALRYARALSAADASSAIPGWALQMESLVREELGEPEAARVLLGALLASGRVRDPQEIGFLVSELQRLSASVEASATMSKSR